MTEIKRAAFSLKNFRICKFSLDLDEHRSNDEIEISFDPEGVFHKETKIFEVIINFKAFKNTESKDSPYISAKMHSYFTFENVDSIEDVPPFFYGNSIAIVFPYLRAFVSNLSLQANVDLLMLPTLNLSSLEEPLAANSKEV